MEAFPMADNLVRNFTDYDYTTEPNSSWNYGDYYYNENHTYGLYDYYTENDYIPHKYHMEAEWEVPIRGFVTFFIALLTIVTNVVMMVIFLRQSSFTPTTIVLTSLAISDASICLTTIPEAVHFNMLGHYLDDYVTYGWCQADHVLYIIYYIFRITSNWITALLGFQRCMTVVGLFKYKIFKSMKFTVTALVLILVSAVLLNIYEMIAIEISELKIYTSIAYNESLPSGCTRTYSATLAAALGGEEKAKMIFYIFAGLLYRIFPVIILVVTTICLAISLFKKSQNFALRNSSVGKERNKQYKRITLVIFIIMIVFLVAELQDGIAFMIYVIEVSEGRQSSILSEGDDIQWDTISSTLSLIGYACNFWIFFLMSGQFRSAFFDFFCLRFRKMKTRLSLDTLDNDTSMTNDTSSDKDTTAL